jgi:hypothetical protein
MDAERADRAEGDDLAPSLRHHVDVFPRHGERAYGVEQDVRRDASPAALGERLGDLSSDRAVLIAVLGVGDGGPGLPDRAEDGRVDLLAVQEQRQAVSPDDGRLGVGLERGEERRLSEVHGRQRPVNRDVGAGAGQQDGDEQGSLRQDAPAPSLDGCGDRSHAR